MNKEQIAEALKALTPPASAPAALVQLGSLGAACVCGIFVPDPLIGVVLALCSLAFGFFVTRLAKL